MLPSLLALKVFILLLPGFLSVRVSERLTLHREKTNLQHLVDVLISSLAIASIYLGLAGLFPKYLTSLDAVTISGEDISFGGFNFGSLFSLFSIAVVVGGAHGFIAEKGWMKNLLSGGAEGKGVQLTRRTGRTNIWNTVFYSITSHSLRFFAKNEK